MGAKKETTLIYGFVPVRKASAAIPGKNTRDFLGKPLVLWVVDALSDSLVDEVIVATNDDAVEKLVRYHPKVTVYRRSEDSAQAGAKTEDVMMEWAGTRELADSDIIVLSQATSPYTTWGDVNACIGGIQFGGKDSILSACPVKRFFWSAAGTPMNYSLDDRPRRQDAPVYHMENGALYVTTIGRLLGSGLRISGRIGIHRMELGFELDEEADWSIGEMLMERKHIGSNVWA